VFELFTVNHARDVWLGSQKAFANAAAKRSGPQRWGVVSMITLRRVFLDP